MKYILFTLILLGSVGTSAKETVQVIFPFPLNPVFGHKIIEEANKLQNDWHFVLVIKPGAGGEIAVNSVKNDKNRTLLATNSSFFIRPAISTNAKYSPDQFKLLIQQCELPMVVVSKKYKSMDEIDSNQRITVGISGIGSTTHLVGMNLQEKFPNITMIPYKGAPDSLKAVLGGEIDISIGFLKQLKGNIEAGSVVALGQTGTYAYMRIPTFKRQNLDHISNNFFLAVSKDIDPKLFEEWKKIFGQANLTPAVQNSYSDEFCKPMKSGSSWINEQQNLWKILSKELKVEE